MKTLEFTVHLDRPEDNCTVLTVSITRKQRIFAVVYRPQLGVVYVQTGDVKATARTIAVPSRELAERAATRLWDEGYSNQGRFFDSGFSTICFERTWNGWKTWWADNPTEWLVLGD